MYADPIIDLRIGRVYNQAKIKLTHYEPADSRGRAAEIHSLLNDQGLRRPLTRDETRFVINEILLSTCDFRYWAERYATIDLDPEMGGGIGPLTFWASQEVALAIIAKAESVQYEKWEKYKIADGIRTVNHKARQLGATMLFRALMVHRTTLYKHQRALAASVSDRDVQELYRRDKLILDNLPWFLKPSIGFDVKAQHIQFDRLNSMILYQQALQKTGLGTGRQIQLPHLTECSSWDYPLMIENDLFPALPRSVYTLAGMESTANGRGNWWHSFSEGVRKGKYVDWVYVFIPWYTEPKRYRRVPPPDWKPGETTVLAARSIEDSSPEFLGYRYSPSQEQMYWWESEREVYREKGRLNLFLTNYCATPEESFQHSGQAAFDPELLERLRLRARPGIPYEIQAT